MRRKKKFKIKLGVKLTRCDECDRHRHDAVEKAYNLMIDYHHNGNDSIDLDEVIGYLGEALAGECDKDFIESLADTFTRVNAISPEDLEKVLKRSSDRE